MNQPLLQDIQAPFDPTAYGQVTGAQLLQLITGEYPAIDKGFIVVTTDDVNGLPTVPDAITNPKWQNYFWARRGNAATGNVTVYVWNPNGANQAPYQQWQTLISANIANGTITLAQLAPGTLNLANITIPANTAVPYSPVQVNGAGTGVQPAPTNGIAIQNLVIVDSTAQNGAGPFPGGQAPALASGVGNLYPQLTLPVVPIYGALGSFLQIEVCIQGSVSVAANGFVAALYTSQAGGSLPIALAYVTGTSNSAPLQVSLVGKLPLTSNAPVTFYVYYGAYSNGEAWVNQPGSGLAFDISRQTSSIQVQEII